MTVCPLYPCGKPSSTGTRNETVKKLTLFSTIISGIIWNHDFESCGNVISSSMELKILSDLPPRNLKAQSLGLNRSAFSE